MPVLHHRTKKSPHHRCGPAAAMWHDGIYFQSPPEHAKFHRIPIGQIHTGIAPGMTSLFRVVQNIPGLFPIAIPSSPALQLALRTAAEFQQLFPVLFKEVEYPGNGRILLLLSLSKSRPTDMNMKATVPARWLRYPNAAALRHTASQGIFFCWYSKLMGWVTISRPSSSDPSCLIYACFPSRLAILRSSTALGVDSPPPSISSSTPKYRGPIRRRRAPACSNSHGCTHPAPWRENSGSSKVVHQIHQWHHSRSRFLESTHRTGSNWCTALHSRTGKGAVFRCLHCHPSIDVPRTDGSVW